MDPGAADTEGFRRDVQHIAAYLYADDDLLTLTRVARIQLAITTLTELFVRVGLCKHISKTVSMNYHPCSALGVHSVEAYGLRMMVEVHTYRERLCQQVHCPERNMERVAGYLASHR